MTPASAGKRALRERGQGDHAFLAKRVHVPNAKAEQPKVDSAVSLASLRHQEKPKIWGGKKESDA
jgi:hypothetical protein